MNTNIKILNKTLADLIQEHIKTIIHPGQVGFIPRMMGCYNVQKSINVIHHIINLKEKIYMVISLNPEKAFDKIQHPLILKFLEKSVIQCSYINSVKVIYSNLVANIQKKKLIRKSLEHMGTGEYFLNKTPIVNTLIY